MVNKASWMVRSLVQAIAEPISLLKRFLPQSRADGGRSSFRGIAIAVAFRAEISVRRHKGISN